MCSALTHAGEVTRPSVEIRRSLTGLQKGEVVLLCEVTKLASQDLYITFQDNNEDISEKLYVDLPEAAGLHSVSREFSVNTSTGMKGRRFTCTVNQGFTDFKSSTPISFVGERSLSDEFMFHT